MNEIALGQYENWHRETYTKAEITQAILRWCEQCGDHTGDQSGDCYGYTPHDPCRFDKYRIDGACMEGVEEMVRDIENHCEQLCLSQSPDPDKIWECDAIECVFHKFGLWKVEE